MVESSSGKYSSTKPSTEFYWFIIIFLVVFSLGGGYLAGIQPINEWRFFSWHPFLMTTGMIGMTGISTMTKKLGGYSNTKTHSILSWLSIILSCGGIYCIYMNKENLGRYHLQTIHGISGAIIMISYIVLGLVGSIFLHPDFGISKTNKLIRSLHKYISRLTILIAWCTAIYGLYSMTQNTLTLAVYGIPLLCLIPIILV